MTIAQKIFCMCGGSCGMSTSESISELIVSRAVFVLAMTADWYSFHASRSANLRCCISSTVSSRPSASTETPIFAAQPPEIHSGVSRMMGTLMD